MYVHFQPYATSKSDIRTCALLWPATDYNKYYCFMFLWCYYFHIFCYWIFGSERCHWILNESSGTNNLVELFIVRCALQKMNVSVVVVVVGSSVIEKKDWRRLEICISNAFTDNHASIGIFWFVWLALPFVKNFLETSVQTSIDTIAAIHWNVSEKADCNVGCKHLMYTAICRWMSVIYHVVAWVFCSHK